MSKGAVFIVLATFLLDEGLAVFGFIARRMVELLNFIVGHEAHRIMTLIFRALDVRIWDFMRVTSFVRLVMIVMTGSQLMTVRWLIAVRTELSLKGLQIESEELVFGYEIGLLVVDGVTDEAVRAMIIVTFRSFILEGMVNKLVHIMTALTVLSS